MRLTVLTKPLNGKHHFACNVLETYQARAYRFAINDHRTGTTGPHTAAVLGAGKGKVGAQHPQESAVLVSIQAHASAVEVKNKRAQHEIHFTDWHSPIYRYYPRSFDASSTSAARVVTISQQAHRQSLAKDCACSGWRQASSTLYASLLSPRLAVFHVSNRRRACAVSRPETQSRYASSHSRFKSDRPAIDDEPSVSAMMDSLSIPLGRVHPGLEHLQDEQAVSLDEARVDHMAL